MSTMLLHVSMHASLSSLQCQKSVLDYRRTTITGNFYTCIMNRASQLQALARLSMDVYSDLLLSLFSQLGYLDLVI